MATLHLLHGFIAAGKTTFAVQLERKQHALRISHDEWMVSLYGSDPPEDRFQEYHERISSVAWTLARRILELDRDVILDFGFWTRQSRDEARAFGRSCGAEVKLYDIRCSEDTMLIRARARNTDLDERSLFVDDNAFCKLARRFEPLEKDEAHQLIDGG